MSYFNRQPTNIQLLRTINDYILKAQKSQLLFHEDDDIIQSYWPPTHITVNQANDHPYLTYCLTLIGIALSYRTKFWKIIPVTALPLFMKTCGQIKLRYEQYKHDETFTELIDLLKLQYNLNRSINEYFKNRNVAFHLMQDKLMTDLYNVMRQNELDFAAKINQNLLKICLELKEIIASFAAHMDLAETPYGCFLSYDFEKFSTNPQQNIDDLLENYKKLYDLFMLIVSASFAMIVLGFSYHILKDLDCAEFLNIILPKRVKMLRMYVHENQRNFNELSSSLQIKDDVTRPKHKSVKKSPYYYALNDYLNKLQLSFDIAHGLMEMVVKKPELNDVTIGNTLRELSKHHISASNNLEALGKTNAYILMKLKQPDKPNAAKEEISIASGDASFRFDDPSNEPDGDEEYSLIIRDSDEDDDQTYTSMAYQDLVQTATTQKIMIQELRARLKEINVQKGRVDFAEELKKDAKEVSKEIPVAAPRKSLGGVTSSGVTPAPPPLPRGLVSSPPPPPPRGSALPIPPPPPPSTYAQEPSLMGRSEYLNSVVAAAKSMNIAEDVFGDSAESDNEN